MEKNNNFSRSDSTLMGNTVVNYDFTLKNSSNYNVFIFNKEITNFYFNESEQTIEVTIRTSSGIDDNPEKTWKEIYGIKDGKLCLLKKVEGVITPGYYVEEKVEFPEE